MAFAGKIGSGGRVQARALGKGDCDFVGDFKGRIIRFDAKSTASDKRFRLADLRRHQVKRIRETHGRGGVAFFLIQHRPTATYWALTWPALKTWWDEFDLYGDPSSIPMDVLRGIAHPITFASGRLDLVGIIKTLLPKDGDA